MWSLRPAPAPAPAASAALSGPAEVPAPRSRSAAVSLTKAQVAVVDPDAASSARLYGVLTQAGYGVSCQSDAVAGLAAIARGTAEVAVVELELPDMAGVDLCRALARHRGLGIIVLSRQDSEVDRIVSLEVGADDFVAKPFNDRELVLRVAAVLRRVRQQGIGRADGPLRFGAIRLDVAARHAYVGDVPIRLTPKETDLLAMLIRADGRLIPRRQLLASVWGDGPRQYDRTLDVHVLRLRNKLGGNGDGEALLTTVRGIGYRLASPRGGS